MNVRDHSETHVTSFPAAYIIIIIIMSEWASNLVRPNTAHGNAFWIKNSEWLRGKEGKKQKKMAVRLNGTWNQRLLLQGTCIETAIRSN